MTETQILAALKKRYAAPAWAFLPQVRNGTGFERLVVRTADAIAMSTWPSRGLELWGFEIKVSRSDWMRELKDPAKAEEIARFVDRWVVVVGDAKIIAPGELPAGWGLLVPKGDDLVFSVAAPKNESAVPMDRLFLSSILRSAAEFVAPPGLDAEQRAEVYDQGRKAAEKSMQEKLNSARFATETAERKAEAFEKEFGKKIESWDAIRVAKAARMVLDGGLDSVIHRFSEIKGTAEHILASIPADLLPRPDLSA